MKKNLLVSCLSAAALLAACNHSEQNNAPNEPQGASAAPARPASPPVRETPSSAAEPPPQASAPSPASERYAAGKAIYDTRCRACHGDNGVGANPALPPLAQSDYFARDKKRLAAAILNGIRGPITVNGKNYDGIMPQIPMKDEEVAAVSNYVLNAFGNAGGEITPGEVAQLRQAAPQ
ncbi:MAG: cytochrome c [Neisseria sp.]|nr:cytochrome c [Neisseria sp.]